MGSFDKVARAVEKLEKSVNTLAKNFESGLGRAAKTATKAQDDVAKSSSKVEAALLKQLRASGTVSRTYLRQAKALNELKASGAKVGKEQKSLDAAFNATMKAMKSGALTAKQYTKVMEDWKNTSAGVARAVPGLTASIKGLNQEIKLQQQEQVKTIKSSTSLKIRYEELRAKLLELKASGANVSDELKKLGLEHWNAQRAIKATSLTVVEKTQRLAKYNQVHAQVKQKVTATTAGIKKLNETMVRGGKATGALKSHMTDLAKSVQVALGPLSGVASRITALTALANRNTAAIAGMIGVMIGLAAVSAKVIRAGINVEKQQAILAQRVRSLGDDADFTAGQLEKLAVSLGERTLASTQDARDAISKLATVSKLSFGQLAASLEITEDLAMASGQTIGAAAAQMVAALESPGQSLERFRRVGVNFTKEMREDLAHMAESGQKLKAIDIILSKLQKGIGGISEAAATNTVAGAIDTLNERFKRLFEQIATGTDSMQVFREAIQEVSDKVKDFLDDPEAMAVAAETLAGSVKIMASAIEFVVQHIEALSTAFAVFAGGAILGTLLKSFGKFGMVLVTAGKNMRVAGIGAKSFSVGLKAVLGAVLRLHPILLILSVAAGFLAEMFGKLGTSSSLAAKNDAIIRSYQDESAAIDDVTMSLKELKVARIDEHIETATANIKSLTDELESNADRIKDIDEGALGPTGGAAGDAFFMAADVAKKLEETERSITSEKDAQEKIQSRQLELSQALTQAELERATLLGKRRAALQTEETTTTAVGNATRDFVSKIKEKIALTELAIQFGGRETEEFRIQAAILEAKNDLGKRYNSTIEALVIKFEKMKTVLEETKLQDSLDQSIQKQELLLKFGGQETEQFRIQLALMEAELDTGQKLTDETVKRITANEKLKTALAVKNVSTDLQGQIDAQRILIKNNFVENAQYHAQIKALEVKKTLMGELPPEVRKLINEWAKNEDMIKKQQALMEEWKDAMTDATSAIGTAFEDAVLNGEKLSDVLRALEKDIIRIILRLTVTKPLERWVSDIMDGATLPPGAGGAADTGGSFGDTALSLGGQLATSGGVTADSGGLGMGGGAGASMFDQTINQVSTFLGDFFDQISTTLTDLFDSVFDKDMFSGLFTQVWDFVSTLMTDLTSVFSELISGLSSLVSSMGSAGGGGGGFGELVGGALSGLGSLIGFQHGGPVVGNKSILVGERGPEVFTPNVGGEILSNKTMQHFAQREIALERSTVPSIVASAFQSGGGGGDKSITFGNIIFGDTTASPNRIARTFVDQAEELMKFDDDTTRLA
jgi:hypothetical protein